jgi:hypothetical protein
MLIHDLGYQNPHVSSPSENMMAALLSLRIRTCKNTFWLSMLLLLGSWRDRAPTAYQQTSSALIGYSSRPELDSAAISSENYCNRDNMNLFSWVRLCGFVLEFVIFIRNILFLLFWLAPLKWWHSWLVRLCAREQILPVLFLERPVAGTVQRTFKLDQNTEHFQGCGNVKQNTLPSMNAE